MRRRPKCHACLLPASQILTLRLPCYTGPVDIEAPACWWHLWWLGESAPLEISRRKVER